MKKDKGKKPMVTVSDITQEILNKLKKRLISMKSLGRELDEGNVSFLDLLPLLEGGVELDAKYIELMVKHFTERYEKSLLCQECNTKKTGCKCKLDIKPSSSKGPTTIGKEFEKLSISHKPKKMKITDEKLVSLLSSIKITKPKSRSLLDKIIKNMKQIKEKNIKFLTEYTPEEKYKIRPLRMIKQVNPIKYKRPIIKGRLVERIEKDELVKKGLKRGKKIIYLEEPPIVKKRKRSSSTSSGSSSTMSSSSNKSQVSSKSQDSSKSFDFDIENEDD